MSQYETRDYREAIDLLKGRIDAAEAIVIGAGAGLSTAAGLTYGGERFMRYFSDFHEKYGIEDMYSGGFYPFPSREEFWAWWSRHIYCNRYDLAPGQPYLDLLALVQGKNYLVITTNVDHQFQLAGFDKRRLFYTQGDYGLFQCSKPCHAATYDNEDAVRAMLARQRDMRIPSGLIPRCPRCGRPMALNLRSDSSFVEDEGWREAAGRYGEFLRRHGGGRALFLELGVGFNTPVIIKYPFWRMAAQNPDAAYACVNLGEACTMKGLEDRSILIDGDIGQALKDLLQ